LQPAAQKFNILHTEWSLGWGGQEQRIILECRMMMELGHKCLIVCQPGSGILAKARENGIPFEEVTIRSSYDPRAVRDIYRLIKKYGITVVNTHSGKDTWVGSFAARLAGVDLLVRTRHLSVPISTSIFNFVHKMADGIITTGESIRRELITRNRIPAEKVLSIATGVSLKRFDPAKADSSAVRKEFGIPAGVPVVTMVAVLRRMKRHDLLLAAARIVLQGHPETRFLLVGDGPIANVVKDQIAEMGLGDRAIMTGYRQDIQDILALSDVVVLTSDRFEGVPQSLSQAMAMSLPVVASPVGSIPELVIDGKTGLLATIGSAESFAEKITLLLGDQGLRTEIGTAARKHVIEGYTDEVMINRTIGFYDYLLRQKSLK
jgi:glycosyltransferase involved in cell wall biosynthesis